tara:strand:+ start:427 stop:573 length:147 start_codon:yes stop_codon:yes gene_type:complete
MNIIYEKISLIEGLNKLEQSINLEGNKGSNNNEDMQKRKGLLLIFYEF